MFDFLFYRRRSEVSRILTGRVNRHCASGLNPGERRASRSSYCEVVWLIPPQSNGRFDGASAVPVVSKDISPEGLSLIHTAPIESDRVLVGLRREESIDFLQCRLEHCTPLGCGYFQIGLHPEKLGQLPESVAAELRQALDVHGSRMAGGALQPV